MSAAEIIEEIKRLPSEEQARVQQFFERGRGDVAYASDAEAERAGKEVIQQYDGLLRKLAE